MILIPAQSDDHTGDFVVVVLGKANLERMRKGDPVAIGLEETGKSLVNPRLLICYEDESPELTRLLENGDLPGIVRYVTRGWKDEPGDGAPLEKISSGSCLKSALWEEKGK